MKQIFTQSGKIVVEEVPLPTCGDNEVLVENACSLISAGTESSSVQGGKGGVLGLASKAIHNPELIQKAIAMVKNEGIERTMKAAKGENAPLQALGYSCSGRVIEVGRNVRDLAVGDRVACAGAGYASHAEVVSVPRNLVCRVPDPVSFEDAAFTTIGAIAMQGVRRAGVQFGDTVVVAGLGLLGQVACQILKAAGARVIGTDTMPGRLDLARSLGADLCLPAGSAATEAVMKFTEGIGADAVIIYAATASSEPVNQAMHMCRKKGRVVVVGSVGMDLKRSPFYEKEIDFLISCSYGPGRYDPVYEEKGVDYPVGYVRWTENRNMQEFLRLVAEKRIDVRPLINLTLPVDQAVEAYAALGSEKRPIGILLTYKPSGAPALKRVELKSPAVSGKVNVALVGAGAFAQQHHLPNLKRLPYFNLRAVVTRTPANAKKIAEDHRASYYATDYREVIKDDQVQMVLIATRHNLHAPVIVDAAKAGKHVFVEKPIAMSYEECRAVYDAVTAGKVNLTVDFNRRFSPMAQKVKRVVEKRKGPVMMVYRVNSAAMKKDHWINDPVEGGGAIVGEGCHFFDFCTWMVGSEPLRVSAEMISARDAAVVDANNVIATIKYRDGSVATIVYANIGNSGFPKERVEIFVDGGVAAIDDYRELSSAGLPLKGEKLDKIEKGQFELIREYGKLLSGQEHSKDLPTVLDGVKATVCSLKVMDALRTGKIQEWDYVPG